MAKATLADFRRQFPEFSETSDESVERALDEALHIHSSRILATIFCAAHLLTLDATAEGGVQTSPEKKGAGAGSLRVDYVTQAENGKEAFFTSTNYGKRFLTLEKRNPRTGIGAMVV